MKRLIIPTFIICLSSNLFSQAIQIGSKPIQVLFNDIEEGFALYADNNSDSTISIKLNFNVRNYTQSTNTKGPFVVPGKTKKLLLTLTRGNGKSKLRWKNGRYSYGNEYRKTLSFRIDGNNPDETKSASVQESRKPEGKKTITIVRIKNEDYLLNSTLSKRLGKWIHTIENINSKNRVQYKTAEIATVIYVKPRFERKALSILGDPISYN